MMKKIILSIIGLFIYINLYSQTTDLYDVNYDEPKNIQSYNERNKLFQDIYLQYELAIKKNEEKIRNIEKKIRQDELKKFQENLSFEQEKVKQEQEKYQEQLEQIQKEAKDILDKALEKQREEIYENEIAQLRKDEHDKLSRELYETISKELSEKYSSEYENKIEQKTSELTQEYEKRFQEKSEELSKEYDSRIAEYEKQQKAEIKKFKKENKKLALEETNALTERMRILTPYIALFIAFAVVLLLSCLIIRKIMKNMKTKKDIESYKREYLDNFKSASKNKKYDEIVKQLRDRINAQQDKNPQKLQNEALQLAMDEYEPIYKKMVIDNSYSEYATRLKKVNNGYLDEVEKIQDEIKNLQEINEQKLRNEALKLAMDEYEPIYKKMVIEKSYFEYLTSLKRVGSKNVYLEEVKNIQEKINNSNDSNYEKGLKYEALEKAKKEFDENVETKSLEDYKKEFERFDLQHSFGTWNGLDDDYEAKNGLISDFSSKIAYFKSTAEEAFNSKNNKEKVLQLLKQVAHKLQYYSDELKRMSDSENDTKLKKQLLQISQQFETLRNQFEKGEIQ